MKKYAKIGLISGVVLCVAGGVLVGIGTAAGGRAYVRAADLNSMDGRVREEEFLTMEKTKLEEIRELELDITDLDVSIQPSGDDNYYLEYRLDSNRGKRSISYEVQDGILHLKEENEDRNKMFMIDISFLSDLMNGKERREKREHVTLYVPEGKELDRCSAEIGDGDLEVSGLACAQVSLTVHSGDLKIKNASLKNGLVSINDGDLEAETVTSEDMEIYLGDGDAAAKNCIWKDSILSVRDGDWTGDKEQYANIDLEISFGDWKTKESILEEVTASLRDGDVKATDLSISGKTEIQSGFGDVQLSIQPENAAQLNMALDTQYGDVNIDSDQSGQTSENRSEDGVHFERKTENPTGTVTVECSDGDITVR